MPGSLASDQISKNLTFAWASFASTDRFLWHRYLHNTDHIGHWVTTVIIYDKEWLFLAPHNLKKLRTFLNQESNTSFVAERYKMLQNAWWDFFKTKSQEELEHYEWLTQKIEMLGSA